ncbi:hypothetical protein GCM10020331_009140 [Ectobacillus funiculus]
MPKAAVDVDDEVITMVKFENGAMGTIEATRNAWGRNNFLTFEIHGEKKVPYTLTMSAVTSFKFASRMIQVMQKASERFIQAQRLHTVKDYGQFLLWVLVTAKQKNH